MNKWELLKVTQNVTLSNSKFEEGGDNYLDNTQISRQ